MARDDIDQAAAIAVAHAQGRAAELLRVAPLVSELRDAIAHAKAYGHASIGALHSHWRGSPVKVETVARWEAALARWEPALSELEDSCAE